MLEEKKVLIKKVKILNDNSAEITYVISNDLGKGNITFTGEQEITEDFKKQFQECKRGFLSCMPQLEESEEKIKMNSIQFDYDKDSDKLKNALYTVKFNFNAANNAVINISTPNLPIYKENFDEKTFCISGKDEDALYSVIEHAKLYLQGQTKTEQLKTVKKDSEGNVVINFSGAEE